MKKINAKEILIGEDCFIGENVEINVRGKFELGRCSVILDGCKITCEEFVAGEYLFMSNRVEIGRGGSNNPDSTVKIGDHVGIFENTIINPNSPITIGNNVGIGAEVMVWSHGSWLDIASGFPADFGPISIGNNVWLPARCIVLPNITIGDNVVIGINSVVTKNIPSGSMAAGIPCRVLIENHYPKYVSNDALEKHVKGIISYWQEELVPHKKIETLTSIYYDKEGGIITLNQNGCETYYDVREKTINGYSDEVSEDFRDFLRRRGLKIFSGKPFKSITPK